MFMGMNMQFLWIEILFEMDVLVVILWFYRKVLDLVFKVCIVLLGVFKEVVRRMLLVIVMGFSGQFVFGVVIDYRMVFVDVFMVIQLFVLMILLEGFNVKFFFLLLMMFVYIWLLFVVDFYDVFLRCFLGFVICMRKLIFFSKYVFLCFGVIIIIFVLDLDFGD